jgi:hypothetical protein
MTDQKFLNMKIIIKIAGKILHEKFNFIKVMLLSD